MNTTILKHLVISYLFIFQYDSGGPMVCYDHIDNQWLLFAVVSTGYGCARAGFPGIYTRVSEFVPWIEETVAKN